MPLSGKVNSSMAIIKRQLSVRPYGLHGEKHVHFCDGNILDYTMSIGPRDLGEPIEIGEVN